MTQAGAQLNVHLFECFRTPYQFKTKATLEMSVFCLTAYLLIYFFFKLHFPHPGFP